MEVITAPEPVTADQEVLQTPTVFLAGGITNCPEWQKEVIGMIPADFPVILFNPRRDNFPIGDPNAAQEQIEWEFRALEIVDIFSMWFCDADSDQPICMYELGRHLALKEQADDLESCVIGVEPGYRREQDVRIQVSLVYPIDIHCSLERHAEKIQQAVLWNGGERS